MIQPITTALPRGFLMKDLLWYSILVSGAFSILSFSGCEDLPTFDYKREPVVEAVLEVGQPIRGIQLAWTQALLDTFKARSTDLTESDATVSIKEDSIDLGEFRFDTTQSRRGWYAVDSSYKVKLATTYRLTITLKNTEQGSTPTIIQGTTTTPSFVPNWIDSPPSELQFPPNDSLFSSDKQIRISWESNGSGGITYFFRLTCLDTLGYGKYLSPETADTNERVLNILPEELRNRFARQLRDSTEHTRWGQLLSAQTPVVWFAFKWFGSHDVSIILADKNFRDWLSLIKRGGRRVNYNDRLGSVSNAIGFFGSYSTVSAQTFLRKPITIP